jgi:hypothetical protein
VLSLLCFVAGGLTGCGASQGGDRVQEAWPVILRAQILAVLTALSAPSFQPVQLAVLYGYRSGVVNVAVR